MGLGMIRINWKTGAGALVAIGAMLLAGCGPQTPPPAPAPPPPAPLPPPPPPPPPRPTPPDGATMSLVVPGPDEHGHRKSPDRDISPAQVTWNLRSAYNVAALNCREARHTEIVEGYRAFLKKYQRQLAATNLKVDGEFRKQYGPGFVRPREKYMTEVYNHFALPPTLAHFCDAVLAVDHDLVNQAPKPTELDAFSARSLPSIEYVFDDFYSRYEKYKADLADWEAKYGNQVSISSQAQAIPAAQPKGS